MSQIIGPQHISKSVVLLALLSQKENYDLDYAMLIGRDYSSPQTMRIKESRNQPTYTQVGKARHQQKRSNSKENSLCDIYICDIMWLSQFLWRC